MMLRSLLVVAIGAASLASSQAVTQLVLWTFGADSASYTTDPTSGAASGTAVLTLADGDLDVNGKDGVGYTDILSFPNVSHDPGQAGAWNDIKVNMAANAEMIVNFSSLGYEDLAMRFDYRSQGADFYDLAYSLDGLLYTQVPGQDNNPGIDVNWDFDGKPFGEVTIDLSGVPSIENTANVYLRLDDLEEMDGNDKFAIDNVEITGVAIPEPQVALLLAAGLLLGVGRRTRCVTEG